MIKLKDKKNIALVLSGGGIKAAAFHIGVCLALEEKGFVFAGGDKNACEKKFEKDEMTIKIYVGSSAGSIISTFLASGYSIQSVIDSFKMGSRLLNKFSKKPETAGNLKPLSYFDIFNLNKGNFSNLTKFIPAFWSDKNIYTHGLEAFIKSGFKINGLFTTKGIEKYFRENVLQDNSFSSLGVKLFIIGTQLNHSRKVIFGDFAETWKVKNTKYSNFASISQAVAASSSLPPFFAPYEIKNQKGKGLHFFDGEIRDTLSTHVAADAGADLVISSYSIQPYHFNADIGSLHEFGVPAIINQALYQVIEQKIERHIKQQKDLSSIYNSIAGYFDQQNLPTEHRDKILEIIKQKVGFKPNIDYIYIHPSPQDHEMFFYDHFSLRPAILEKIVQIGFKSALNTLRQLDI